MDEIQTPVTTAQFVHNKIKKWILTGELVPGQKVDQDAIASQLGVSRMPIRTALEKLAVQDFVELNSHRGATVKSISAEHLEDIYLVRHSLESLAVKLATENITDEDVKILHEMIQEQKMIGLGSSLQLENILAANRKFHSYIYQLANRPVLMMIIDQLWDQSERYRRILLNQPGMMDGSTSEHSRLVDLMSQRLGEEASKFLIKHNDKTKLVVLEVLKTRELHSEGEKKDEKS